MQIHHSMHNSVMCIKRILSALLQACVASSVFSQRCIKNNMGEVGVHCQRCWRRYSPILGSILTLEKSKNFKKYLQGEHDTKLIRFLWHGNFQISLCHVLRAEEKTLLSVLLMMMQKSQLLLAVCCTLCHCTFNSLVVKLKIGLSSKCTCFQEFENLRGWFKKIDVSTSNNDMKVVVMACVFYALQEFVNNVAILWPYYGNIVEYGYHIMAYGMDISSMLCWKYGHTMATYGMEH